MTRPFVVALALVATLAAFYGSQHFVRRYALYVADGRGAATSPYRLFLEPFPDAVTCARAAAAIDHEGGNARCKSSFAFASDSRLDDEIAADFRGAAGSWFAFCTSISRDPARLARRPPEKNEAATVR